MKLNRPLQLKYGGIALLCIGVAMAALAGIAYVQANQAMRWPTANARIVRSEVEVSKKVGGVRRGQAVQSDFYTAAVRYEYAVHGRTYTGTKICLDESHTSGYERADAEEWVRRYPVGASVRIHHAPNQPERSVIDPLPGSGFLAGIFILGKLVIIGGASLVRTANQMEPPVEAERRPAPVAVEQELPSPQPARRTHWTIRALAVVVGLMFFLVGCLCLPVSVKRYVQAAAGADVNHAVNIIVIFIMAGIALFGAFLVWLPLRRIKPTISLAPQTSPS
jgi:hypothetical protein